VNKELRIGRSSRAPIYLIILSLRIVSFIPNLRSPKKPYTGFNEFGNGKVGLRFTVKTGLVRYGSAELGSLG